MPETPNYNLPYPSGTSLAAGHSQIQALAEALDNVLATDLPQGQLGYAQATANQDGITTEVDLTGLSVTIDMPANRRIKITGSARVTMNISGARPLGSIHLDGSQISTWADINSLDASSGTRGVLQQRSAVVTPAAGSRTFKLTLQNALATGTVGINASGSNPAFILVEDLGPA